MLLAIARFEVGQRLRRLSTWIYFTVFLLLGFLFFITAAGAFKSVTLGLGTGGKVMVNSPHTLAGLISTVSYFALLVTASLAGQAVPQDFLHRTYPLLFTAPIRRGHYLGGRFLGALFTLVLIQASTGLGCLVGSLMPFVDRQLVGPNQALAYLAPYLTLVLPNLLVLAPFFFALGALTRGMRAVYVSAVVLFVGYLLAGTLSSELQHRTLAALLDPFGSFAFERLTQYWTPAEKNSRLIPLAGVLLWNRLIWLPAGLAVLGLTFLRFRLAEPLVRERGGPAGGRAAEEAAPERAQPSATTVAGPPPHPLRLLPRLTWLAFRETVKNAGFLAICLAGVLFLLLTARLSGMIYGTEIHPVTRAMIEMGQGFRFFTLLLIIIYSGELVWREREASFDQIVDALPVPGWLLYASKLGALVLMCFLIELLVMACGLGFQISKGYHRFELGLYAVDLLGLKMVGLVQLVVLALFFQALLGHKHLGQFAMVLFLVSTLALPIAGFRHNLYLYGGDPGYSYSDMNGFGHFLGPWGWFNVYWSLAALLLAQLSVWLWPRGQETALRQRLRLLRARSRGLPRLVLALTGAAFAASGGFIYYNTNVLNRYRTSEDDKRDQVAYERQYKPLEREPQPRINDVRVRLEIYPERRSLRARGTYRLENRSGRPIPKVYVNLVAETRVHRLALTAPAGGGPGLAQPTRRDEDLDFYTFALPAPLPPGATLDLEFDLERGPRGFKNDGGETVVVGNGTFAHSTYLPLLGYQRRAELGDADDRRKRGLPPRERTADLDDPEARKRNYVSPDADWTTFAATACTSADQIAVVPGYLVRKWQEPDGRSCFAYESQARVLHFFSVLSARYAVHRDRWREVDIEVFHHPGHEFNVARMVESVKASLEYFTKHFSPYQHRQVRILEFPRYELYAQAFPNTIPYSEALGFIARPDRDDPDDTDFPYYVTAHEVAHQWWAHQVIGADAQGSTLLSESLAQYSALMVMKQTFGPRRMKRFLRHELDGYLRGRALERKKELPLLRVEDQGYIHYQKGSLAFYALADAIGEEKVNRALAALLAKHAFRGPPYPTSRDLLAELRAVTPPERQELLRDLFETITLYENRALSASARRLAGTPERWRVTLRLNTRKLRADEAGNESEVPLAEEIDLGVLGADDLPLHLERRRLRAGEQTVELEVTGRPLRAGVDPQNKLVDRTPDDNLTSVELDEAPPAGKP